MTTWQRKARTVIGLIALCLGVTVFLTLKERSSIETLDDLNGLNSDLIFHSTKSVVTQVTGEKRNLRIEAEQHFAYSDGSSRLEGVRVVVEGEKGKDISLAFIIFSEPGAVDRLSICTCSRNSTNFTLAFD